MADERIEVEWIATASRMTQILDKIDARLEKQDQKLEKISKTSEKAAEAAAGSFNAMESELKQAEAALNKLTVGTAEFAAQKAKVDGLRQSLTQAKVAMQGPAAGMSSALSAGVQKLASFAAGMVTIQKAIEGIVFELSKAQQLRIRGAETARTFEEAMVAAAPNLMAQGDDAVKRAASMALEAGPRIGADPGKLIEAMAQAISAGATSLEDALAVSEAAITLTAGNVDAALPLIGGALDVARAGGTKDFRAALGQLLQTQSESRGVNIRDFVTNIGPGLAAAAADMPRQNAVTTERALELAGTISTILSDPTMANTATTMRMLFTRLGTFTPEREVKLEDGSIARVNKQQIEQFNALRDFDARMQMMFDVPAIGQQFLETQRESIGKVAIQQIIERQATAMELMRKAEAAVTPLAQAAPAFAKLQTQIEDAAPMIAEQRRAEAQQVRRQVENQPQAIEGQIIERLRSVLANVDESGLDMFSQAAMDMQIAAAAESGNLPGFAIARLEQAMQQARVPLFGSMAPGGPTIPVGGQITPEDQKELIDGIKAIAELGRQLQAAREQAPPKIQVQTPAARPKEAPLPAVTSP